MVFCNNYTGNKRQSIAVQAFFIVKLLLTLVYIEKTFTTKIVCYLETPIYICQFSWCVLDKLSHLDINVFSISI